MLFESACHFCTTVVVKQKWQSNHELQEFAAWIQPPGGLVLIGWSRACQRVRPDLCRRGPITPSQKGPAKKKVGAPFVS